MNGSRRSGTRGPGSTGIDQGSGDLGCLRSARGAGRGWATGRHLLWLAALPLLALATGCGHKIGDSCSLSTDCSANGDRLCDTTQPGGYCTQFNCEPDSCPSGEAVCTAFTEPSCPSLPSSRRFLRTFCMKPCEDDGDCRAGYVCRYQGSNVVDSNPSSRSVCVAASNLVPPDSSTTSAICEPGPTFGVDAGVEAEASLEPADGSVEAADVAASDTTVDATPAPDQSAADGAPEDVSSESVGAEQAGEAGPDALGGADAAE